MTHIRSEREEDKKKEEQEPRGVLIGLDSFSWLRENCIYLISSGAAASRAANIWRSSIRERESAQRRHTQRSSQSSADLWSVRARPRPAIIHWSNNQYLSSLLCAIEKLAGGINSIERRAARAPYCSRNDAINMEARVCMGSNEDDKLSVRPRLAGPALHNRGYGAMRLPLFFSKFTSRRMRAVY